MVWVVDPEDDREVERDVKVDVASPVTELGVSVSAWDGSAEENWAVAEGVSGVVVGNRLPEGVVVIRSCGFVFTFSGVSGTFTLVGCTSGVRETLSGTGVSSSVHISVLCRKWESLLYSAVDEIGMESLVSTKILEMEISSVLELASEEAANRPFRLALLSASHVSHFHSSRCVRPKTRRSDTGQ